MNRIAYRLFGALSRSVRRVSCMHTTIAWCRRRKLGVRRSGVSLLDFRSPGSNAERRASVIRTSVVLASVARATGVIAPALIRVKVGASGKGAHRAVLVAAVHAAKLLAQLVEDLLLTHERLAHEHERRIANGAFEEGQKLSRGGGTPNPLSQRVRQPVSSFGGRRQGSHQSRLDVARGSICVPRRLPLARPGASRGTRRRWAVAAGRCQTA
eukprot:6740959-Prymnesium_polylepis.4